MLEEVFASIARFAGAGAALAAKVQARLLEFSAPQLGTLARLLAEALPPHCRHRWRLLFSSARDGASFSRLCAMTIGRAPVLLVVRDTGGAVFGGVCTQPLQKAPHFYGAHAVRVSQHKRFLCWLTCAG